MKTFNTRTLAVLPLAAVIALMTGCATIDNATQKVGGVFGSKSDTTRSATGGAILGCGAGAIVGHLLGKPMLASCAVGGVVAAGGAVAIHKHQVAEAHKLADEARAAGAHADVRTSTVQVVDKTGKSTDVEKLDSMTIRFEPADVRAHGSASAQLLAKTARLADASSEPVTINVRGPKLERTWMNGQVTGALKAATTATVTEAYDKAPELVLTPVPNVKQ
jgi:hypothetical protein